MTFRFTPAQCRQVQERGLASLLAPQTMEVYLDAEDTTHTSRTCLRARRPTPATAEISWRDLSCPCWSASSFYKEVARVNYLLRIQEDLSFDEASSEYSPEAFARLQDTTRTFLGDETDSPEVNAWVEDLRTRQATLSHRLREELPRYQLTQVRTLATQRVREEIRSLYASPRTPLEKRRAVRELVALWADGADALSHVGSVAATHGLDPTSLGRYLSLALQDASVLRERYTREIWEGEWNLVVYGEKDLAKIAPFLLRTEGRQNLAALPAPLRRVVARWGLLPIRCVTVERPSPATFEVAASLWDPTTLLQDGALTQVADLATLVL